MDPLPPDPYAALGVPRDADASLIKSTYRKIVLKTHPDKFTDEAVKKQKQEEFHKIQQAYEIIGDEEKRAKYDAEVRLQQLRKEKLSRASSGGTSGGTRVEVHASHYGVRTAAPADASFPKPRYEERKPARSASYDEDKYYEDRSSSRKYPDTYDAYPTKRSPPRASREKESVKATRAATERTRTDDKKSRDKQERRDRSGKYAPLEEEFSSADEKVRYEAQWKKRDEEEEARRLAADARRRADDGRRHRSDDRDHREKKYNDLEAEAKNHIHRTKEGDVRPSPVRSSSRDYHSRRGSEAPRRSSARPKESSRPTSSGRDRERVKVPAYTQIVDWETEERDKMPSLKAFSSSPPRVVQRSYTDAIPEHRRQTSPTPGIFRSSTMPTVISASRREKPSLRSGHDSGYSTASSPETAFPTVPQPLHKVYQYSSASGGVHLASDDIEVANGYRTVRRAEPGHDDRHRASSPPPILTSRPPIGSNRVVPPSSSSRYAAPPPPRSATIVPPPPLGRSSTMNMGSERRGEDRGRKLFGEVEPSDYFQHESSRRTANVRPEKVIYAPKLGHDDIRWSSGRDGYPSREKEYSRPSMKKYDTFVY